MPRMKRIFAADLETTVYAGQTCTEAWSASCAELYDDSDHVDIFSSLPDLMDYWLNMGCDVIAYFHNLKFDGAFILDWLMTKTDFKPALDQKSDAEWDVKFRKK